MPRLFKVGFASCVIDGMFGQMQDLAGALRESWRAGTTTTRYGRTWYLAKPEIDTDRQVWTGRIGFLRESDVSTVLWDEAAQDFVRHNVPGGVIVPFAITTPDSLAAFQLRPRDVRPTTFTGALQSLLTTGSRTYSWRVRPLVVHTGFEQWRVRVQRVTDFRFRLERPNPHYHDNDAVESMIESLSLQVATLRGQPPEGQTVNTNSTTFRQMLDHVRLSYGHGVVRGEELDGQDSEWRSTDGGVIPTTRSVESSDEDEIDTEDLIAAVLNPPADATAQTEMEPDDYET